MVSGSVQAKDIVGRYGFAGEWSVEASLSETEKTWYGSRLWAGPARTRHTGLCAVSGNPEESGTMTVRTDAIGRTTATLKAGQLDCEYVGRLGKTNTVFATCRDGLQLPMTLWVEQIGAAAR